MPENDFERQVQEIFGEMKLKPSEAVWPKVQERISREKKRRRMLVWLPAALLLLLAGGTYLILQGNDDLLRSNSQNENAVNSTTDNKISGNNAKAGNTVTAKDDNNNASQSVSAADPVASSSAKSDDENKLPVNVQANSNKNAPAIAAEVKQATNETSAGNNNNQTRFKNARKVAGNQVAMNNKTISKILAPGKPETETAESGNRNDADAIPVADGENWPTAPLAATYQYVDEYRGLRNIDAEKELKNFAPQNNKPVIKLAKRKSWEWGVSAQVGASAVGKGLSGVFKNGLFEKAETLDYAQSSPNAPNNAYLGNQGIIVAAAPPPASAIKTGMAWNAGGFGKWYIKEKLALTFGAEYNLYTTNREVGNIMTQQYNAPSADANARFAANYTGTDGVNYTNRYHFIQVPVGVQWQVNKGVKLPFQLDAGLTFGYLVNTNAVHYRSNTGAYYEDKSLFNKFQTGLYAGFSAKLFQHTKRPLYVGPVVQYNLSDLAKPSSGFNQNFIYAGLKLQWVLWKN